MCDNCLVVVPTTYVELMMCALMDCDVEGFRNLGVNIKLEQQIFKQRCVTLRATNVSVDTKRSAFYRRIGERLGGNMPVKVHLDKIPNNNGTLNGYVTLHDSNGNGVFKLAEALDKMLIGNTCVRFLAAEHMRPEGASWRAPIVSHDPQPPNAVVAAPQKEDEEEPLPTTQAPPAASEWDVPTGDLAVIEKLKDVQLVIQQFEAHLAKLNAFKQALTAVLISGR